MRLSGKQDGRDQTGLHELCDQVGDQDHYLAELARIRSDAGDNPARRVLIVKGKVVLGGSPKGLRADVHDHILGDACQQPASYPVPAPDKYPGCQNSPTQDPDLTDLHLLAEGIHGAADQNRNRSPGDGDQCQENSRDQHNQSSF